MKTFTIPRYSPEDHRMMIYWAYLHHVQVPMQNRIYSQIQKYGINKGWIRGPYGIENISVSHERAILMSCLEAQLRLRRKFKASKILEAFSDNLNKRLNG